MWTRSKPIWSVAFALTVAVAARRILQRCRDVPTVIRSMGINPTGAQLQRLLEQVALVSTPDPIKFTSVRLFSVLQLKEGQAEDSALIPLERFEQVQTC